MKPATEIQSVNIAGPRQLPGQSLLWAELRGRIAVGDLAGLARDLVARWMDGRIKLYTIHRALGCRRAAPHVFRTGTYVPLEAVGPAAGHVCAFARVGRAHAVLTVVPRLTARLTNQGLRLPLGGGTGGETGVRLPAGLPAGPYVDQFTGTTHHAGLAVERGALALADVLADFPVALLAAGGREGT